MSCLPKLGETRVIELMWVGMRDAGVGYIGKSSRLVSIRFAFRLASYVCMGYDESISARMSGGSIVSLRGRDERDGREGGRWGEADVDAGRQGVLMVVSPSVRDYELRNRD